MTLVLTVFGVILYTLIRSHLLRQLQDSLLSTAQIVGGLVERDEDGVELEVALDQLPEFSSVAHPKYYRIWDTNGVVIAKSTGLDFQRLSFASSPGREPDFSFRRIGEIESLCIAMSFVPREETTEDEPEEDLSSLSFYHLAVSQDAREFFGQLCFFRNLIWLASLIAILLSFLAAKVVVQQTLRPVKALAGNIATISATDLCVQVSDRQIPQELLPVVERLNELLSRLDEAFTRERLFTADVAHELRSPLSGLRSILEVTLRRDRECREYRQSLCECAQITVGMHAMVENLLTLARLEGQGIVCETQSIKLTMLIESCWQSAETMAKQRDVTLDNHIPEGLCIQSDPTYLAMIWHNILNNAAEYSDHGSVVTVEVGEKDGFIEISVCNLCSTLTSDQQEHLFDCFWRADTARSATGLHCGLGLSLVQRIMHVLGGTATAEVTPGRLVIQLRFPIGSWDETLAH